MRTPREPPTDILRREPWGEAEAGEEFREEKDLEGGSQEGGAGRASWGEAVAIPGGSPSEVVGADESHCCWSLRASSLPATRPSPQEHPPHQLLEAPFRSLPGKAHRRLG